MSILIMVLSVLAPVVAMASVGVVWRWTGRDFPQQTVSTFVMNVAGPCLVISSMAKVETNPIDFAAVSFAALAAISLSVLAALALVAAAPGGKRAYVPMLVFGNTGNLGLSVCFFAYGEQGLALGSIFFVTVFVLHTIVGPLMFSGKAPLTTILKTPIVYAGLLGGLIVCGGLNLPVWIERTADSLGAATIPLMLVSLGYTLGGITARHLGRSILWSLARMMIGLGAGFLTVSLLNLHGTIAAIVILEASMPSAALNYIFALNYKTAEELSANVIFLSTAVYLLVLPVLLWQLAP